MAYIGKTPTIGNFQKCDAITVVNGQAAYTMQVGGTNVSPESENHMLVSLNGILQAPVDSFTISGSTITFASNLATGDVIDFIMLLGNVLDLGVPSDNTVSNAKIVDSTIALGKLSATGTKDATTFLRGDNTFATPSGGSFELVTRTAVSSAVADVEFTNLSTSGENYLFIWNGIDSTANSTEDFLCQVSTDNGSSFRTSGYKSALFQHYSDGAQNDTFSTTGFFLSEAQSSSDTSEGNNGYMYLMNMQSSQKTAYIGNNVTMGDTNRVRNNVYGGFYDTAEDTDAVRFKFESGNISGSSVAFITMYKQVIS